jgi:hypothetical protein
MLNRLITLFVFLFFPVLLKAQQDTVPAVNRFSYFNAIHSGVLMAKKDEGITVSVSTLHGVRYKNFFAGLGIGYDAYNEWRMVPFFATLGVEAEGNKQNFLFFQLEAGYALARNIPVENFQVTRYKSRGGGIVSPMVGYRIKKENISLYFMTGYRFQRLDYETNVWWGSNSISVKREIQRITFHIGFGLN